MAQTMTKAEASAYLNKLACAILETVNECGALGAPAGVMYAGLMSVLTLDQFEGVMSALVLSGKLVREGHVYYAVKH